MRFLSIYRCVEKAAPPTQEEITRMGALIEEQMKSGLLLAGRGLSAQRSGRTDSHE